jgi:hypothetical protein
MVLRILKNHHIYKINQVKDIILMKKTVLIKNMPLIISLLEYLKKGKHPVRAMGVEKMMDLEI